MPYDIELSLNHSVIVGRVLLPGHEETGFNRNVTFRTEQYKEAPRRIKIISSLVVGDTEVRKYNEETKKYFVDVYSLFYVVLC